LYEQLLSSLKQQDCKARQRWYKDNRVPKMTFLLNKIVDQWRITMFKRLKPGQSHSKLSKTNENPIIQVSTPSQKLNQLLTWQSMEPMLLIRAHSYALIMQAAVDDYNAEETPMLCESIFRRILPTRSLSSVDRRTLPDALTYTMVLQAWRKCTSNPEAIERIWNLFNEIHQLHKDGILETPLNSLHCTIVISALMRTGKVDWMNLTEQFFQPPLTWATLTPGRDMYTVYLHGWLNYNNTTLEQWHRCKAVLNNALERSKASPEEPLVDAHIFSLFILKAGYLGRDNLAEQTYAELCHWHKQFPVTSMAPNVYTLKALVLMYIRTRRPDAAEEALFTLIEKDRGQNHLEWATIAHYFNEVIQCWLKKKHRKRMVWIVQDSFCYVRWNWMRNYA
jgi:hypothetical protein